MTASAILALIDTALLLVDKIPEVIEALKRDVEMTPEEEAELDERIRKLKDRPHWQLPDQA